MKLIPKWLATKIAVRLAKTPEAKLFAKRSVAQKYRKPNGQKPPRRIPGPTEGTQ